MGLDKTESSILKNILLPLEEVNNPAFSPLKATPVKVEKVDIKKSPPRMIGRDITVKFTITKEGQKSSIKKSDILTLGIVNNNPLIDFIFKF